MEKRDSIHPPRKVATDPAIRAQIAGKQNDRETKFCEAAVSILMWF